MPSRPLERHPSRLLPILLAAGCLFASILALLPTAAGAADWSSLRLPGEAAKVTMFGISCPTATLCVAVGGNNTIASSTEPTGGAPAWNVAYAGKGAEPIAANFRQVRGVSCPSPQLCVAVTFEGLIYTSTDPTGDAGAWNVTDLDPSGPNTHLYGISCPTVDFCAAVAGGAKIVTSTDPLGGAGAWTETQLEGPMELRGISCTSVSLCVAVGDDGDNIRPEVGDHGVVLSSTDPLGGAWQKAQPPSSGTAYGVACPAAGLCVSGDLFGNLLVSTAPATPTSWRAVDAGGSVQITDVDCPSPAQCAAVDLNGDVLTSTDPTGRPEAWRFVNLAPFPGIEGTGANGMFGISCPSASLCAVAANDGQIFTSGNPFASGGGAGAPAPTKANKGRKRKRRPLRPRATIASGAPPVESASGPVTVLFRFFVRHRVAVRGFVCKLDRRPLRPCHSPKRYRVGYGHHVFRVRAIGWTGLRGPVATWRFQVCHPTHYRGCIQHLPPPTPPPAGA